MDQRGKGNLKLLPLDIKWWLQWINIIYIISIRTQLILLHIYNVQAATLRARFFARLLYMRKTQRWNYTSWLLDGLVFGRGTLEMPVSAFIWLTHLWIVLHKCDNAAEPIVKILLTNCSCKGCVWIKLCYLYKNQDMGSLDLNVLVGMSQVNYSGWQ